MRDLIEITGSTGQLGRRVVRHLEGKGRALRLVVRDAWRAPQVEGADVVEASFESGFRDALEGARVLFLVSGHEDPNRIDLHRKAVAAAAAAGIERVVYTSFMGASPNATFTYARDHCLTEVEIVEAEMSLTALRSSLYADIAPWLVGGDGVIRGPAGRGKVAWVAREDVARLAAAVLLDDSHAGRIYDVSGPEPIDLYETAALLTAETGKSISYVEETIEEARASRAGAEEWQIDGWIGSYAAIATGETSVTSHSIEHITGRRPWTFAEFLREQSDSWAHLVASPDGS
jgi:uncharacterized protein YbjT (DUF2867 family)